MEHLELEFLANSYFDKPLPSDKWYLTKYFKSELQQHFLKYVLLYKSAAHFVDHTGYFCTERYLWMLKRKYRFLENEMKKAKENFDFNRITEIESGKVKTHAVVRGVKNVGS